MPRNPNIQTAPVNGRPRCLMCSRRLRPRYDTKREGERKLLILKSSNDIPDGDYAWTWEKDNQMWTKVVWVNRVVSRTWDGTYGDMGEGLFCNTRCGYRFGRDCANAINKGLLRLAKVKAS